MPKLIANTKNMDFEEWLSRRDNGIGGSDAASVAGVNPYKNAVVTYMEKIGAYKQPSAGEAAYWGNQLEPIVRNEFVKRINKERDEDGKERMRVQQRNAIFAHSEYEFMRANVDGLIFCPELGKGILECKTANQFLSDDWDGEDIPNQYYIQVQHYMAVMDVEFAYVAVLIGGQKFKKYFIKRDQETIDYLIAIESNFWINHVLPQVAPEMDGADSEKEMMKMLYPESVPQLDDQPPINLPSDCIEWTEKSQALKELAADIKQEATRYENEVKACMATTEQAFAGMHKITWKTDSNGVRRFKITMDADNHKAKYYDDERKKVDKQRREIDKEAKAAIKEQKARDKAGKKALKAAEKTAKDSLKESQKALKDAKKQLDASDDFNEQEFIRLETYKSIEQKLNELEAK